MEIHFTNLLIVAAIAFTVPLTLGLAPGIRLPSVVLELVAGIIVGPDVLGWVEVDEPVEVLSIVGLAFLLFLAGLEIEFHKLRGRVLKVALGGFAVSFAIVVVPVLKDAREIGSTFGQLVVAGATIADFGTVILLSLFFSREATSTANKVLLLVSLFLAVLLVALAIAEVERSRRIRA